MRPIKAFTLLELIIVIIIIGVLTSLALPKLFSVIEGARAAEAIAAIGSIRSSMDRCFLINNGSYFHCILNTYASFYDNLDIENPEKSPGSHFRYLVTTAVPFHETAYVIIAIRNSRNTTAHQGKLITFGYNGARAIVTANQKNYTFEQTANHDIYWDASDIYRGFIPR